MNFENNPIADRVEKQMRSLQKSGVKLNAGSEYNRVFEAFYDLFKRLDESEPSPGEDVQRMAEQTIKEIAGIAWKGAANAFRMYPENKHTFFGYWDAAKNQFAGYSAHPPAPAGMEEALTNHLKTAYSEFTDPAEVVKITYDALIESSKIDFIAGFKAASTPPAKDNWVKIEDSGLPTDRYLAVLVCNNTAPKHKRCVRRAIWFLQSKRFIIESTDFTGDEITHYMPEPDLPTT